MAEPSMFPSGGSAEYVAPSSTESRPVNIEALEQPYGTLRLPRPRAEERLLVSMEARGQKTPLIVIPGTTAGTFGVVDGHKRLRALRKLKADVARAEVWDLPGSEALARVYQRQSRGAWNALEEGALVEELHRGSDRWSLGRIARELERTVGWASRRLGLVRDLQGPILEAVRRGRIGAHSAVTCLLPLSRDNKGLAERLADKVAAGSFTSREIRRLYDHCRQSPATVTERIAADPAGFLNALAAARTGMDLDLSPAENKCLDQLRLIGNLSLALARRLPEVWAAPDKLRQAFATCRERFTWLEKTIGGVHAGS
jgi:ParB-like chromosome segregation protein Spo0J